MNVHHVSKKIKSRRGGVWEISSPELYSFAYKALQPIYKIGSSDQETRVSGLDLLLTEFNRILRGIQSKSAQLLGFILRKGKSL